MNLKSKLHTNYNIIQWLLCNVLMSKSYCEISTEFGLSFYLFVAKKIFQINVNYFSDKYYNNYNKCCIYIWIYV